jgi:glycosyltransferase involved in cell wall biosynthesis
LSNQIKVLYVNQSSNYGGAEIVLSDIYENINGISKYIIGPIDYIKFALKNKDENVYISKYFGNVKRRKSKTWMLILLINIFPASFQILGICIKKRINIVHANNYTSLLFCILPKMFYRFKLIWHCHDTIVHHKYEKTLKYLLSLFCDVIYSVSNNVQEHLTSLGINKSKIVIIKNGILENKFVETSNIQNVWGSKGPIYILCATSSFNSNKGIHIIIEAFNYLKNKRKQTFDQIFLNIYGDTSISINNYLNQLTSLINKYDLNNKIFFPGFKKPLSNEMTSHHICIIPSQYYEAFPMTCLEAMYSETLVVSSQVGGLKEIIIDRFNGVAFKKSDHKMLAEKIVDIINNKDDAIKFINQAKKDYQTHYTFDSYLSKITTNYRKLIQED